MSNNSVSSGQSAIPGDPLLVPAAKMGSFSISLDVERYFYPAAAHRPIIKNLRITNNSWSGDDEIIVSLHTESFGANSFVHRVGKAFPPIDVGRSISFDANAVRPNFKELAQLDEIIVGDLVVRVTVGDVTVAEERRPIDFLAYNQWVPDQHDHECLSAFVFPNHPVVVQIMDRVRNRLLLDTKDGTTSGYQPFRQGIQAGLIRNDQVMKAIFEELQAIGLEYSNPPQTFEGYGQKVRTPDVVMRDNVATCLDSTVLAASCIGAAGLKPIIFLVEGHAFPGVWSWGTSALDPTPGYVGPSIISNINDFQGLTTLGRIMSFESTQICRSLAVSFENAKDRHLDYANGKQADEFESIVDVIRSRESGIRGLPNRFAYNVDGEQEIEIDRAAFEVEDIDVTDLPDFVDDSDDVARERLDDGGIPSRMRKWMDALLDVSNSNPLISLSTDGVLFPPQKRIKSTKGINIPLVQGLLKELEDRLMSGETVKAVCLHELPSQVLQNPDPITIVDYFVASGALPLSSIEAFIGSINVTRDSLIDNDKIAPAAALTNAQETASELHEFEATRRFKALKKMADDIEADSATNQLFLTIGTLAWTAPAINGSPAKDVRSPLFVVPVRLSGNAHSGFGITLDKDGDITPNYCLVEKLRSELKLQIPELETPELDEFGVDVNRTISQIRRRLSESRYSSIRVDEEAQIAVLDFATFRVWKDLRSNWRLFTKNPIVDHLISGSNATFEPTTTPFVDEALTPFSCDESQMEAVNWALDGKSFVLEGPPGTGKSQTIANVIAASMAAGKRVLFVAEKQVALDAVSRKLEEIGLDPFCITMHHETTTPDSIRHQLRVSLDFEGEDVTNQWNSDSNAVKVFRERLSSYRDRLIQQNDLGYSSLTAHQEVIRRGDGDYLVIEPELFAQIGLCLTDIESALLNIQGVVGSSRVVPDPHWALATVADMDSFDRDLFVRLSTQLRDILTTNEHLRPLIQMLMETAYMSGVPTAIAEAIGIFSDGVSLTPAACQEIVDSSWMSGIGYQLLDVSTTIQNNSDVLSFFELSALQLDLTPQMMLATEAMSAGLFKKGKRAEQLRDLMKPIVKGSLEKSPAEILTLLQRVPPIKAKINHISDSLRAIPHLKIRSDFDPLNDQHLAEVRTYAESLVARAKILSAPEASIIQEIQSNGGVFNHLDIEVLDLAVSAWSQIKTLLAVTSQSLSHWTSGQTITDSLIQALPTWVDAAPTYGYLSRVALINQTLEPLRRGGLTNLEQRILTGDETLEDIHGRFMRGVAVSARSERLNSGNLATFDSRTFDQVVAEFTRRDENRRELMSKVIPRQLSDSRPFRPRVRTGEIGNLERELTVQRRRVSVAQLIKEYGEIITQLAPCFLMSPEAVSRLLPAESQFFDMVIFDEASQIRVASAIPAMGRAKAAIVVGDSQQMPPSQVIGKRQVQTDSGDDLDDQSLSKDLESILSECKESHVPTLMLKCHFRSQHEGLIAFSNRNFYEGELVTFPAPNTDTTTPISWFEVPTGEFLRSGVGKGTNPEEANAIVREVIRRVEDPQHAGKSIGVVTFNDPQAGLIRELLDGEAASHPALLMALQHPKKTEKLFVVPLERVQGDERDTIILSVSYSYQGANRTLVSPTWGPLTHKGGERRLNVAITRAKKDLLIFCSFNPNHVNTENSKNKGVPYTVEFLKECRDAAATNGAALKARDVVAIDLHRKKLFDLLRNNGIRVRENVGLSKFRIDLSVADAKYGDQFLAILLDGDSWSKRTTPFDRDVLPNNTLRVVGWRRIGRVWLKLAVEDPAQILMLVQNEIEREQYRHELMSRLEESGFEVRSDSRLSQIGVDIAIRKPSQNLWPLAISIDGPDLFRQYTPYEGDIPPAEMLREVQCIEGVSLWLPDVKDNPQIALDRVNQFFDRANQLMATVVSEMQDAIEGPKKVEDILKEAARAADAGPLLMGSPMRQEFVDSKTLPVLGDQSILGPGAGENLVIVRRAAAEIVELEGPITEDRLARVLVARFGMAAVREARKESLKRLFADMTKSQTPFGTVYWSGTREPITWKGFRTSTEESSRAIDDVPAEELVNAMVAVVALGNSCYREEIIKSIADVYGRKAVTRTLNDRLGSILDWAVQSGLLIVEADLYKASS